MYIKCHYFITHFNRRLLFRMAWDVGRYRRDFCTIISTSEKMRWAGKKKKMAGGRESESEKENVAVVKA